MTRPYQLTSTGIRGGGASGSRSSHASSSEGLDSSSSPSERIYVSADPTDHCASQTVRLMEEFNMGLRDARTCISDLNESEAMRHEENGECDQIRDVEDMYKHACNNDATAVMELLRSKEWCRSAIDHKHPPQGNTLLHVAAEEANTELVRLLLQEANASPFIANDYGLEPSSMAGPNTEAFKLLVAAEDRLSDGERKVMKRGAVREAAFNAIL
ncbi:hypothetical protein FOL46_008535 [Perkinsus olseni]|uniref:Uncharacterized protein n=1 Tax=Perkinsus olseni TaxID=32597 RepID=A0A7J6L6L9_PEROL|nr:hypothetical protein FOL46_008535 [Perkinsus olseni]